MRLFCSAHFSLQGRRALVITSVVPENPNSPMDSRLFSSSFLMETFLGIIKPTEFQVPRFSLEGKQGENDRCIIVGAKHMAFVRVLLVSAGVNSSHFFLNAGTTFMACTCG